jgi:hypothetical protein
MLVIPALDRSVRQEDGKLNIETLSKKKKKGSEYGVGI